ncbi:hypothetical protein [Oceanirhabdus sp. W0125-5]|uniref:hypothetical protein n=1 Tax=Oceanirhabdus sp. W0125-5 TaxID=2999116 RepID=UPI0022F30B3C|nr:hypothetical protein [Oceanirhabdus sp. W0125-5]WBW97386.1 hypothetical protein OW730_00600 [Oceanirhabdus sp. W0125-5]
MNKMKKSLLTLSFTLLLLLGTVITAFAYEPCDCGGKIFTTRTKVHQSYRYHDCVEHSDCVVKTATDVIEVTKKCTDCSNSYTYYDYVDLTPYHIRSGN